MCLSPFRGCCCCCCCCCCVYIVAVCLSVNQDPSPLPSRAAAFSLGVGEGERERENHTAATRQAFVVLLYTTLPSRLTHNSAAARFPGKRGDGGKSGAIKILDGHALGKLLPFQQFPLILPHGSLMLANCGYCRSNGTQLHICRGNLGRLELQVWPIFLNGENGSEDITANLKRETPRRAFCTELILKFTAVRFSF